MAEPERVSEVASRRRPRWFVWVIALAGVAVVAGVVYAAAAVTRGNAASDELDRATQLIEDADVVVVSVDQVIGSQVTSELAPVAAKARADVATAAALLSEAVAMIDRSEAGLSGGNAERAALLRESAEARLEMLAQAPTILGASEQAAKALPMAAAAWAHVIESDRLSDRAVAAYNKLTGTAVKGSKRLNRQSTVELGHARDGFAAAEEAFPEAGFEDYLDYVAMRMEMSQLSESSDEAWLSGQLDQANSAISAYNDLDARAVAAAKALPTSPAAAVAVAYSSIAKAATDEYYVQRKRATAADAQLRGR